MFYKDYWLNELKALMKWWRDESRENNEVWHSILCVSTFSIYTKLWYIFPDAYSLPDHSICIHHTHTHTHTCLPEHIICMLHTHTYTYYILHTTHTYFHEHIDPMTGSHCIHLVHTHPPTHISYPLLAPHTLAKGIGVSWHWLSKSGILITD